MLAKKAGLGDAQIVFAAVNGLTPVFRQAVLTKEANNMETVRKWATIAEGAVDNDHNRRSPTLDTNRSRPQGSYQPTQKPNNNRPFDRRPVFNNPPTYNYRPRSLYPGYTMRPSFQQAKERLGFQQRSSLTYSLPNNQRILFNSRPSTNFSQPLRGNYWPTTNDPAICINCGGKRHAR